MSAKLAKMLAILVILSMSVTLIMFSYNSPWHVHEQVWSLNFSDLWIGSKAKIVKYPFQSMHYLFSGQLVFQTYRYLARVNRNLETTIECIGPSRNQSCLFKNLYYINRTFWILTTKKPSFPLPNIRIGFMVAILTSPSRRRFYSYADLEEFVRLQVNPIVIPDLTVYFEQLWMMNIGHALFDGLYPAYVALIRFPPRHLRPFRILLGTNGDNGNYSFSRNVYNRFAGLETINASILEDMSIGRWFAFEELVMGSGDMCQRCLQPHLQLPGGVELDGSRLFRDRMYKQHGLTLPVARRKHSAEGRDRGKPLRVVVIDNKRFNSRDRIEIGAAIDQINMYADTHRSKTANNRTKLDWPLLHAVYISYAQISINDGGFLQLHASRTVSKLEEEEVEEEEARRKMVTHLRLLQDIDIHITGPGTGQMYQTFLSDGSVNINLGGLTYIKHNATSKKHTSFMEQYMTAGTPYIKGLYYPITERLNGIRREVVIRLIRQAAQLIREGFAIPVNPRDNLAAYGHLFLEMCELDRNFCAAVTERFQQINFWCFNTWPESIIYETGQWSKEGMVDGEKNVTCPYNRTLLNQLRAKYNIGVQVESPLIEQK